MDEPRGPSQAPARAKGNGEGETKESAQPRGRLGALSRFRALGAGYRTDTSEPSSARRGALPKDGQLATEEMGREGRCFKPASAQSAGSPD